MEKPEGPISGGRLVVIGSVIAAVLGASAQLVKALADMLAVVLGHG